MTARKLVCDKQEDFKMLPENKVKTAVEWGFAISRVKTIMLNSREKESSEELIEATRAIKKALELSWQFPCSDLRRFLTLSTSIALFCHLRCYGYVEFDRHLLLRISRRYPRPIFGDILNNLGMLYQEHGKIDEAGQMYRQAVKLLPTNHPRFPLVASNLESLVKMTLPKELT